MGLSTIQLHHALTNNTFIENHSLSLTPLPDLQLRRLLAEDTQLDVQSLQLPNALPPLTQVSEETVVTAHSLVLTRPTAHELPAFKLLVMKQAAHPYHGIAHPLRCRLLPRNHGL